MEYTDHHIEVPVHKQARCLGSSSGFTFLVGVLPLKASAWLLGIGSRAEGALRVAETLNPEFVRVLAMRCRTTAASTYIFLDIISCVCVCERGARAHDPDDHERGGGAAGGL